MAKISRPRCKVLAYVVCIVYRVYVRAQTYIVCIVRLLYMTVVRIVRIVVAQGIVYIRPRCTVLGSTQASVV